MIVFCSSVTFKPKSTTSHEQAMHVRVPQAVAREIGISFAAFFRRACCRQTVQLYSDLVLLRHPVRREDTVPKIHAVKLLEIGWCEGSGNEWKIWRQLIKVTLPVAGPARLRRCLHLHELTASSPATWPLGREWDAASSSCTSAAEITIFCTLARSVERPAAYEIA